MVLEGLTHRPTAGAVHAHPLYSVWPAALEDDNQLVFDLVGERLSVIQLAASTSFTSFDG